MEGWVALGGREAVSLGRRDRHQRAPQDLFEDGSSNLTESTVLLVSRKAAVSLLGGGETICCNTCKQIPRFKMAKKNFTFTLTNSVIR